MKTKFKGTQGDWHTVEKNMVIYIENKDQVLVAELDNHKTLGFNQATPTAVYFNAKLIAAAPALLEELILLLKYVNAVGDESGYWPEQEQLNDCRNAIKKATE